MTADARRRARAEIMRAIVAAVDDAVRWADVDAGAELGELAEILEAGLELIDAEGERLPAPRIRAHANLDPRPDFL